MKAFIARGLRALATVTASIIIVTLGLSSQGFTPPSASAAPPDIVLDFTTTAAGQDAEVPIGGQLTGVVIDWGDSSSDTVVPDAADAADTYYTHTYAAAGSYIVTISGTTVEHFGICQSSTYASTLKKIVSWGDLGTTSLECAGYLRGGLIEVPASLPSTVTDIASIFKSAYNLNQSLSGWVTTNVTNMTFAFYGAHKFNGDVTSWDTSNVTDMSWMFADALLFNQNISSWNTSSMTDMNNMFYNAVVFNQSLANWDVQSVVDMRFMFDSSGLSNANYSSTLIGWSELAVAPNVTLGATGKSVVGCDAIHARNVLTKSPNLWTIIDGTPSGCDPITLTLVTTDEDQYPEIGFGGALRDVVIDWGDGSTDTVVPDAANAADTFYPHVYGVAGTYAVTISGTQLGHFGKCANPVFAGALTAITSWGSMNTTSLQCAGFVRTGLTAVPTTVPSTVTNVRSLFGGATAFAGDIRGWNTANITDFSYMFADADAFNGALNTWNLQSATTLEGMFSNTSLFNRIISGWNVSNVTNMSHMFEGATAFNQTLGTWSTRSVTDMSHMFDGASAFNQTLETWNIANVTDMSSMLSQSGMSNLNYSKTLTFWAPQFVENGVQLNAAGKKAEGCPAIAARQVLRDAPNQWSIQDTEPTDDCGAPVVAVLSTTEVNETAQIGFGGDLSNVVINWGEYPTVTTVTNATAAADAFQSYSYAEPGRHKVIVSGNTIGHFGHCGSAENSYNLIEILSWGDLNTSSFECVLNLRTAVTSVPNSIPDSVTNLDYAFQNAHIFDQDISGWNTSNVTSLEGTFRGAFAFNNGGEPLTWNTSNVTNMVNMFSIAESFNADITSWNTARVTNMAGMFSAAPTFNQSLGSWNIGQVADMTNMFESPLRFLVSTADQSVTNDASLTLNNGVTPSGLSDANYSATLAGWASQTVQPDVPLGAAANQATGCTAVAARTTLTSAPNNWLITDIAPTEVVPTGGCAPAAPSALPNTGSSSNTLWQLLAGLMLTLGAAVTLSQRVGVRRALLTIKKD